MKTYQQTGVSLTRKLLVLIVSTFAIHISKAQDAPHLKTVIYKVVVGSNDIGTAKGYLSSISDTTVYLSVDPVPFRGYSHHAGSTAINYNTISYIMLRRKGSTGKGMWMGAVAGAAAGALVGFASGDDQATANNWCIPCFSAGQKAVAFGLVSGLAGTLVGAFVGSIASRTFNINNKKEPFNDFKWQLTH